MREPTPFGNVGAQLAVIASSSQDLLKCRFAFGVHVFSCRVSNQIDGRRGHRSDFYPAFEVRNSEMDGVLQQSKVPEVTLTFWLIKILATTLGETGGDAVTMSMNLGYAVGTLIFLSLFIVCVVAQIRASAFHPFLYWTTIVATTTVGTTMADLADRSLGVGYAGGSA